MKKASLVVAFLVIVSAFCATLVTIPLTVGATTLFVGGTGPGNYTTIQSAIDDAAPGDTIYAFKGIYTELIEVDKTLSLVEEDRDETIIKEMGLGHVVDIKADWVSFWLLGIHEHTETVARYLVFSALSITSKKGAEAGRVRNTDVEGR